MARKKKAHYYSEIITIKRKQYITDGYYKIPVDTFKSITEKEKK